MAPLKDIRTCPTYVINLDRRPDRWAEFSKQPELAQFKALKRFSAVDGSKLNILQDDRVSLHTRINIQSKSRRSHYEIATAGAVGASLSHITIWKEFLASDSEYVVVFEDDTIVDKVSMAYIDTLIRRLPASGWDMWLLGTHRWAFDGKPLNPAEPKGWWKVNAFTGAHAYVLSRRGAEILLQQPFPIETHIEYYITGCAALKGLRLVKHWALRMTYSMEQTQTDDSDTFDGRKSCPVCFIPDKYPEHGVYVTHGALVGAFAVALVATGGFLGYKCRRS